MQNKQRGLSLLALVLGLVVAAVVALVGMKVFPAYSEFLQSKKAIGAVAANEARGGSVVEIRKAFDRYANIDNITTLAGTDLDISKDGGELVISFAYSKKIPLFYNVSLLIDFAASTAPGGRVDKE
jgi:Tfp pilus assembly protein PilE